MKILKLQLNKATNTEQRQALQEASQVIAEGGLVIYPTETTYGLGVDPANQAAVSKLLQYKSRREGKPLSVAVSDQKMAARYVEINQQAENFYQRFLPGPYTVISKLKQAAPLDKRVSSEFNTLGIRIPDYELILNWLKMLNHGITATGANASDKKRPYTINDILDNLSDRQKSLIDLIIDVGQLPKNEPSTVIDTTLSTPLKMRGNLNIKAKADNQKPEKYQVFNSESEAETSDLAGRLMLKHWNQFRQKGLIFGLNGELGMGKTIFAKGIAKFLHIDEEIVSPTYSYMNEYPYQRHQTEGLFYHLDAWKIDQAQELELLDIASLVQANQVLVIEWWQQVANFLPEKIRQQSIILELSGQNNQRQIKLWDNN